MKTTARARFVRVSARKARLVLDQIRGKPVGEALATLEYTPRAAARLVEKVLRSAVANAEHNHQVRNLDDLRQLTSEISAHYANLDWAVEHRRMDLPKLREDTEARLRAATSEQEARAALQRSPFFCVS